MVAGRGVGRADLCCRSRSLLLLWRRRRWRRRAGLLADEREGAASPSGRESCTVGERKMHRRGEREDAVGERERAATGLEREGTCRPRGRNRVADAGVGEEDRCLPLLVFVFFVQRTVKFQPLLPWFFLSVPWFSPRSSVFLCKILSCSSSLLRKFSRSIPSSCHVILPFFFPR